MKKVRHGLKYDVYEIVEIVAGVIVMGLLTWAIFAALVTIYK